MIFDSSFGPCWFSSVVSTRCSRCPAKPRQLADQLGTSARLAGVYSYLINYHYLKGEPDQAIEYGQRCLTMGDARRDAGLQALARRYVGHSYHAQGRYRLADPSSDRTSRSLTRRRQDPLGQDVLS